MMLGVCRQAALCGSSLLIPYVSTCACQLSVGGHIICRSTVVNADRRCYIGCLGNTRRYCSRYVQGLAPHRLHSAPPWKTVFFGTDEYALVHLKALNENRVAGDKKLVSLLEVVVPTDHCVVASYARDAGLMVHEWPLHSSPGVYDVGVVVSFGHLIPKRIIDLFPYGILNVHPSILPRWRGASPIIHTILNDDKETGISVMEIRPAHFDIGPLLLQTKYPVPENCTAFQLRDYLALKGSTLLMRALKDLPSLEKMEYEQDVYGVTYAHKVTSTNARLDFELRTQADVHRQYRALGELFDLRSQWKEQPVRLLGMVSPAEMQSEDMAAALNSEFPADPTIVRPGTVYNLRQRNILCIRCRDGWLGFGGIVYRKPMTAKSFYNGFLSKCEQKLAVFTSLSNDLENFLSPLPTTVLSRQQLDAVADATLRRRQAANL